MGSPNDLAMLPDLKSWLDISGDNDDILLGTLISQTSRAILNYIDRPSILPNIYTDNFDGGNERSVLLRQWPVTTILSCTGDNIAIRPSVWSGSAVTLGYVLDAAEVIPPGRMQRLSLRCGTFAWGLQNISVSYYAGYQIMNELGVVPAAAPFQVTVQAPYGEFGSDLGVTDTSGVPFVSVSSNPSSGQYTCATGVYTFSSVDTGASILLSYGYVPSEIAHCCIEWAAERYQYRSRIGQHSKSLGGQETVSFVVKDIPDYVATVLQPYRRVVTP